MAPSLEILSMKNLTSEMDILGSRGPLVVTEYGEKVISFTFFSAIQSGVLVSMQMELNAQGKKHAFVATGKVLVCSEPEKGQFRIQLQLRQFEVEDWAKLLKILRGKQNRADQVFSSIKED
jgi:hypothetical protein